MPYHRENLLLKIDLFKKKQIQRRVYFTSLCHLAAYGEADDEGEFTLRQLRLRYGITNKEHAHFMEELSTISATIGRGVLVFAGGVCVRA